MVDQEPSVRADGPLAGVRILDLSRVLAGPYAAMLLGDLGAEVIKVERPGLGDDTRHWGPPFVDGDGSRESTYFLAVNRSKRSVTIDLKDPANKETIWRLVRWADVLIENFRPGVMERLGLDDPTLASANPGLVRLSISGFGESGPERDRVGYDQILQAEGGVMSLTGDPSGQGTKVGIPVADITAGLFGVIGILAALVERSESGVGQRVSTSLLASQIAIHTFQGSRYLVAGEVPGPSGEHHPTVSPYGTFAAGDGPVVIAVGNDELWARFAPLVGLDGDDARFATNEDRVANRSALHAIIAERFAGETVERLMKQLSAAGVPAGEVKSLDRVYQTPQVRAEGLVWEGVHRTLGEIELPGHPLAFARTPASPRRAPPTLGEHDDEVREELGEEPQS